MKKLYSCPAVEVMEVQAVSSVCGQSKFGPFIPGGGTPDVDPETGGV